MSHHSDDNFVACSDSFWEPGNYKKTTKRIEEGNKLCTELATLVSERAEIEKTYATKLNQWSAKWKNTIEKGQEYGTTEAAWKAVLVEADRRCELHNKVKEDLNTKVNTAIKSWQKEAYHKSLMTLKEKKEMDDAFKKAQKPWAKLLLKVNKAKSDYHAACKSEKSAVNQERNANSDSAISPDQLKKLGDRVSKAKEQVSKTKDSYTALLSDLNRYNPQYMENMTEVFERCQMMEGQRLQKFKEVLFTLQKCLNISEKEELPLIYEEFYHTVNNADHEKDLRWWSNTYGVQMAMQWPDFEEYTEEFREIAGKSGKKGASGQIAEGNITLINQRHVGDDLPEFNSSVKSQQQNGGNFLSKASSRNNGHSEKATTDVTATQHLGKTANNSSSGQGGYSNGGGVPKDANPFEDEEWDDGDTADPLVDTGEPGVKVKALYDYEAAEEDELDFKTGDVFEKLEDEDEQGWCKGRKDGKVGLYPANYIEVVQ